MAELTPLFMDINNVYSGDELGLPYRDLVSEGTVAATDLAVTQRAAGANLSVDVAAGACWVAGDTNPARQPTYRCLNDAVVNKGITPDPSNPRKVLVVAQITDETFAGTGRNWQITAIHGTPAASPAEPALPASALPLALVDVAANATSITNANITDRRVRAASALGGGTGGGGELGYAQITANVTLTVVVEASAVTVINAPAITVDGSTAVIIEFYAMQMNAGANGSSVLNLWEGASNLGLLAQIQNPGAGVMINSIHPARRLTPTAGSHTYTIKGWAVTAAGTVGAGAGGAPGAVSPAYIRISRA